MIESCALSEIQHFNDMGDNQTSHIYEGRTPISWYALRDPDLIGCFGLLMVGRQARLRGWFVHPDHRGQGHGLALVQEAEVMAPFLGADEVEAKTREAGLMARAGWRWTGKEYPSWSGRQYIRRFPL